MKKSLCLAAVLALSFGAWLLLKTGAFFKEDANIYRIESSIFANAVLISNPEIEDIFLYLVFPSGEAANPFDEGLAHYVEHLAWLSAFSGSQVKQDRHSNAWTNHFSTGYWQRAAASDLDDALKTLVSVSHPLSVEEEFALEERSIILREYDYRVAERPLFPVFRDMDRTLYGSGALARSVIGDPDDIAEYSLDAASSLHMQSHDLAKATLLIYGNVSKRQLESTLASLSVPDVLAPAVSSSALLLVEPAKEQNRATVSISGVSENAFMFRKLVPLPACETAVRCAILAELAESALSSSLPGGLAGALRYDQFVTRSFSLDITLIGSEYVEMSFTGHPDTGVSLEYLETAFHTALRRTLQNGLPRDTFDRVRSRLSRDLDSILARDQPSYNRDLIVGQLMSAAPEFTLEDQVNATKEIRPEEVDAFLQNLLEDGREVTRLVSTERQSENE